MIIVFCMHIFLCKIWLYNYLALEEDLRFSMRSWYHSLSSSPFLCLSIFSLYSLSLSGCAFSSCDDIAVQAAVLEDHTARISRHRWEKGKKIRLAAAFVIGQRLRRRVRTAAASGQPRPDAAADIRPNADAYAAPLLSIYVPRDP